jgi:hypothetical protein
MTMNRDFILKNFIQAAYNLQVLFKYRSKKSVSYYLSWTYQAGSLLVSSNNQEDLKKAIEELMRDNYNLAGTETK